MEVVLTVNGNDWSRWISYSIESSMLTFANAFSITANIDEIDNEAISPGDSFRLTIDDSVQMNGYIDEVISDGDAYSKTFEITGRDLGAFLVDSCASPKSYHDQTLQQIAEDMCSTWFTSFASNSTDRIKRVKIEPGEKISDVLLRLCEKLKLWCWVDPDGTLVIDSPNYSQDPSFLLFLYNSDNQNKIYNNVERYNVRKSIRDRYSSIKYYGTSGDTSVNYGLNSYHSYSVADDISVTKNLIVVDGDIKNKSTAQKMAEMDRDRRIFEGTEINYTVSGHHGIDSNGDKYLFNVDMIAMIDDEINNLSGNYYIVKRRFNYGLGGRITELTLMQKDLWP